MSVTGNIARTPVGNIQINGPIDGDQEAIKLLRSVLENARVYFPLPDQVGYNFGPEEPSVDDRDKPWLRVTETYAQWFFWSCQCQKWVGANGVPGERLTRYRINDTVQEDIDEWYPGGWELADGNNILGIDLRDFSDGSPGTYTVLLPTQQEEYCISSIQTSTNVFNVGGVDGITSATVAELVDDLNAYFSTNGTPLTADYNAGVLELIANDLSTIQQVFACDESVISVVERIAPIPGTSGDEVPNQFFGRDSSSPDNEYSYYTLIYTGVCT